MGSKTPPPGKPPQACPHEDDAGRLPLSAGHAIKIKALQRIADALQVPPAVLYQPQNAIQAAPMPVEQMEGDDSREGDCATLIHAFLRISDPEERRRILSLVQASAERA
ncbi:hypothetical protein MKK68_13085 [Methylobacterium sp. E-016]|uniref:hypothetical protein n=1 Tax=Methylobacterium sp. E-016 TaxID=2836556 RepID=UPI001FB9F9C8|nr:hypothetical protein [Methylobacterium sp. E-016]MCJ2076579.1 hypothetical protein [Methylobacterium sp. E-016]